MVASLTGKPIGHQLVSCTLIVNCGSVTNLKCVCVCGGGERCENSHLPKRNEGRVEEKIHFQHASMNSGMEPMISCMLGPGEL